MSPIKLSTLLLSVSLIAACNFQPVHARNIPGETDGNLAMKLESVQVTKVGTREGQVLKEKLDDLLSPSNRGAAPAYRLDIKFERQRNELGIQGSLRVTRYDIVESGDYKLVSLATNQTVDSGKVKVKSSFNRTESEFSTFVAEEDASEKAAEELAQEIKQHLVAYFSK